MVMVMVVVMMVVVTEVGPWDDAVITVMVVMMVIKVLYELHGWLLNCTTGEASVVRLEYI